MTIVFNEVFMGMAVIPNTVPWRLYIDMDEEESVREEEGFGLKLVLEYGDKQHHLCDSDSIREGDFCECVELEDVEELFEVIILKASEWLDHPNAKHLSLDHIVNSQIEEFKEHWRKKYKIPCK